MSQSLLNQVIAVISSKKQNVARAIAQARNRFGAPSVFNGLERTYRPIDDQGERLPGESVRVQAKVDEVLSDTVNVLTELFDTARTLDEANCLAKADVVVDGVTLLEKVPATHLIFLEKQLAELHSFISGIPVLEPAERWTYDTTVDSFATAVTESARSKKVEEAMVLYPATPQHPAQTKTVTRDVLAGYWSNRKFSTAWPTKRKSEVLAKIEVLREAVVKARELANSQKVENFKASEKLFQFIGV